jgi:hypothetical protein
MRPNVRQQNPWAQAGIAACALLLPPLALGAALYSMLAAPDQGATHPTGASVNTQAPLPETPRPAAPNTGQAKAEPADVEPAEEVARKWNQILTQGSPGQAGSGQVTSDQLNSGQVNPVQANPVQVTSAQAAAGNPRTAGGAPAAADGQPAPSAPKRANRRHARQQQEEFPLQNWLQQMGILPRSGSGGG